MPARQKVAVPLRPRVGAATGASIPGPGKAVALASLEVAKIHWSSALSGKGSKYGTLRIMSMYPGSLTPQGGESCAGHMLAEAPPKPAAASCR